MHLGIFVILLVKVKFIFTAEPPGGYYKTRYDHLDVETILNQKRLVRYYSNCLLYKGPCTPQGIEFRRILPEAIRTNCLRCTEKQRYVVAKSIRRLKKEYPTIWEELSAQWDPTGEYVKKLEDSLTVKPTIERLPTKPQTNIQKIPVTGAFSTIKPVYETSTDVQQPAVSIGNRFGEDEEENSVFTSQPRITSTTKKVENRKPYPPATKPSMVFVDGQTSVTSFASSPLSVTSGGTTLKPSSSSSGSKSPSSSNTKSSPPHYPFSSTPSVSFSTSRPYYPFNNYPARPFLTVSLDPTTLIVEPLKKISNLGTHVVKKGAQIADMVVATVQNVLGF